MCAANRRTRGFYSPLLLPRLTSDCCHLVSRARAAWTHRLLFPLGTRHERAPQALLIKLPSTVLPYSRYFVCCCPGVLAVRPIRFPIDDRRRSGWATIPIPFGLT